MNIHDATKAFSANSRQDQIAVLARYAHAITVRSRGTYVFETNEVADPKRLRYLNEIQHRVTAHIIHLVADDNARYPDDVLLQILLGQDDVELQRDFEIALK